MPRLVTKQPARERLEPAVCLELRRRFGQRHREEAAASPLKAIKRNGGSGGRVGRGELELGKAATIGEPRLNGVDAPPAEQRAKRRVVARLGQQLVGAKGGVGQRVAVDLPPHSAAHVVERAARRHGHRVGEYPDAGWQRLAQCCRAICGAPARVAHREHKASPTHVATRRRAQSGRLTRRSATSRRRCSSPPAAVAAAASSKQHHRSRLARSPRAGANFASKRRGGGRRGVSRGRRSRPSQGPAPHHGSAELERVPLVAGRVVKCERTHWAPARALALRTFEGGGVLFLIAPPDRCVTANRLAQALALAREHELDGAVGAHVAIAVRSPVLVPVGGECMTRAERAVAEAAARLPLGSRLGRACHHAAVEWRRDHRAAVQHAQAEPARTRVDEPRVALVAAQRKMDEPVARKYSSCRGEEVRDQADVPSPSLLQIVVVRQT
eukprot:scaffold1901_cov26-Tisochrysis_lutea.AAC.1